jgi:hypothetical protein
MPITALMCGSSPCAHHRCHLSPPPLASLLPPLATSSWRRMMTSMRKVGTQRTSPPPRSAPVPRARARSDLRPSGPTSGAIHPGTPPRPWPLAFNQCIDCLLVVAAEYYSPFLGIEKGAMLKEACVFHDPQLDVRRCSQMHGSPQRHYIYTSALGSHK